MASRCLSELQRLDSEEAQLWLLGHCREWEKTDFGIYTLGRVADVESVLGPLRHREIMTLPSYAFVVLQGFVAGAGIRHAEYHLAKDLILNYQLFADCDSLMARDLSISDEARQSLGRTVILTCFNLIEAFVSGLATEHLHMNPDITTQERKPFEETMTPLRKRFLLLPGMTRQDKAPMVETDSMVELFEYVKPRRDAFVHCSPGDVPTRQGIIKDETFHEITMQLVDKAVDCTLTSIDEAWRHSTGSTIPPSWLPKRLLDRSLGKTEVRLVPESEKA